MQDIAHCYRCRAHPSHHAVSKVVDIRDFNLQRACGHAPEHDGSGGRRHACESRTGKLRVRGSRRRSASAAAAESCSQNGVHEFVGAGEEGRRGAEELGGAREIAYISLLTNEICSAQKVGRAKMAFCCSARCFQLLFLVLLASVFLKKSRKSRSNPTPEGTPRILRG